MSDFLFGSSDPRLCNSQFSNPQFPDRAFSTFPKRESVKLFLIGKPEPVQQVIQDLYAHRFCEVTLWSKPLTLPEMRDRFTLSPGEIMRVYKRYLTQ
jgi:hypothetical protein